MPSKTPSLLQTALHTGNLHSFMSETPAFSFSCTTDPYRASIQHFASFGVVRCYTQGFCVPSSNPRLPPTADNQAHLLVWRVDTVGTVPVTRVAYDQSVSQCTSHFRQRARNRLLKLRLSPQCHRMPWAASHLSHLPCSNLSPLRAPERAPCYSFRGTPTLVDLKVTLDKE